MPSLEIPPSDRYRPVQLNDLRKLPQAQRLSEAQLHEIEVVGNVFPFKTNRYVTDRLIDWSNVPNDPMFVLNFPQRGMLMPHHFLEMETVMREHPEDPASWRPIADSIREELNPHPAGQLERNVPTLNGEPVPGMQHKYRETVLFFPSQGQTCHAYCTFCFRWPQFVGKEEWKFASKEAGDLTAYLQEHPEVTDVLFTGGDPMIMRAGMLEAYIRPLLEADLPNLRTIRIGTKSLSYWPQRFVSDKDADDVLRLFRDVAAAGKQIALMAHVNHGVELSTPEAQDAVARIRQTGAMIRSQTPLLRRINDTPQEWVEKWQREVRLGIVPYYMFVVRDTGAQHFFGVPLVKAWKLFRDAYSQVSGLGRTVRGPSMSADPGKVEVLGPTEVAGERVLALRMLQGRDPSWVGRPFFAKYDETAQWLDDLQPAFEDSWFFDAKPLVRAVA